ncbi:MAG: hypothetical protein KAS73_06195 [Candidatus Sabulitectum sp.]|nr:hypothetical protein [Candidatus Sabulitectum sp.]
MLKFVIVLCVCVSISLSNRLIFLGQTSLSDYSPAGTDTSRCQYAGDKVSTSLVIQYQFTLTDLFDGGVELDVAPFHPFRWTKEETEGIPSSYTYDYTEYSFSVFLAANRNYEHVTVFAKAVPGLYLNKVNVLHDYYGYYMSVRSADISSAYFGLKLMTGIDIPLSETWGVRLEGGRTFLRRDGFPYYWNPLDKLDSWNLRLGIIHGTL